MGTICIGFYSLLHALCPMRYAPHAPCPVRTEMTTIRQQMIRLLEEEPRDARELSQLLGIKEKDVYEHLAHVGRSVRAQKKNLKVLSFSCLICGFVFENRRRFTRPGRCPRCKGSRLEYPLYKIE